MGIFRVIIMNALILIALGLYGYFTSGSATALIAPAIGVVLIALSFPVKNNNKTAAHIVVVLTLIAATMFFVIGFMRNNMIVLIMAIFTVLALVMYIMDFSRRKKERESA